MYLNVIKDRFLHVSKCIFTTCSNVCYQSLSDQSFTYSQLDILSFVFMYTCIRVKVDRLWDVFNLTCSP